jgi:DNA helicase-2/ATP-dependent DNA helicase PcrA
MDILDKLNPQQRKAVTAGAGPVLVVAGPGSGKTRVLTQRVAYLIAQMGVRPWQILAVTFTNKAAREMESRVQKLLGAQMSDGLTLGTFHAICARILRREADYLPIQNNFVIYDADDQQSVVKGVIRDLNLNEKLYRAPAVHAAISRAKNELLAPDQFPEASPRDRVVKRIYAEYQKRLIHANAVDFDDLLLYTAQLLEENLAVREKYARKYVHILVDEFQDTNIAQYVLLKHLCSIHQNIFCVGDPDQSVYRWRGADYRNVLRFEQDFPGAQVILLEQNYRSRQLILDTAMAVIDQGKNRKRKQLFTERGQGERAVYYEAGDDYGEAAFVVESIAQLVAGKQFQPGEIAVMYRTNAMSRLLEEAFLQARLPYRLVGAQRFYGRREVKDVIAYLRLVHNPADDVSLDRIVNVPARGLGEKSLLALHTAALQNGITPGGVLIDLARGADSPYWKSLVGRTAIPLAEFGGRLKSWIAYKERLSVSELFDLVVSDIRYKEYLDDGTEEGTERWENVQELRRLAVEYKERTLTDFLENVALVSDQDTIADTNAPTLLTLHAAKGLEFGAVFLIGLDDGTLPHSRSFDEPEAMEEERRLFYVGITRAKDKLFLVRAERRGGRGYSEEQLPSRFLDDIPAELLNGRSRTGRSFGRSSARSSFSSPTRWQKQASPAATISEPKYRAGMRIKHPLWGEGIVLDSKGQGDDETVDVVFESVGIKRLAASLANIKVL